MAKYLVDEKPSWLVDTPIEEYDLDFIRIIDFYQFHAPVPGQAAKCITIQEYGWESPWKKPYWLNKQMKLAASNYELLFTAQSKSKMEENLEKANLKDFFP